MDMIGKWHLFCMNFLKSMGFLFPHLPTFSQKYFFHLYLERQRQLYSHYDVLPAPVVFFKNNCKISIMGGGERLVLTEKHVLTGVFQPALMF